MADRRTNAALPARRRARGRGGSRLKLPSRVDGSVDSHCHLQHEAFNPDRDAIITRAVDAGIERLLVPGYDVRSSAAAVELARRHRGLIDAAVGIHPHHAAAAGERDWHEIERLATDDCVVAIGEIGLDFHRNLSPPDVQREALTRQLDLAEHRGLPVIVHDRDAHAEVTERLTRWSAAAAPSGVRGVLHCFTGDAAMAAALSRIGFLVSFALPVTFSSAGGQRDAAAKLDSRALLTETDSPWLGAGRETRNEPTTVLRVAAELARLRGATIDEVARDVRAAYRSLVGS